jgi:dolichol-phosphate mannosyltransferase
MFDEVDSVPALTKALQDLQASEGTRRELEFVLVDDGSRDRTWEALAARTPRDDPRWRLVRHDRNRGLTAALRTGTETARHELVGWLDADLTYDPGILAALASSVDRAGGLAVASCHHPEGRMEGVPPLRRALSRPASRCYRLATRHRLHTFTCMVRVQARELALRTWPEREGFLGVTEQLLRVLDLGSPVAEVPAILRARDAGRSKMRVLRATMAHLGLIAAARRGFSSRGAAAG